MRRRAVVLRGWGRLKLYGKLRAEASDFLSDQGAFLQGRCLLIPSLELEHFLIAFMSEADHHLPPLTGDFAHRFPRRVYFSIKAHCKLAPFPEPQKPPPPEENGSHKGFQYRGWPNSSAPTRIPSLSLKAKYLPQGCTTLTEQSRVPILSPTDMRTT